MLKDGGLIGGVLFDGNNATARSGGALFIPGWNALVQDSKFARNEAAIEAGAMFVYGRAALFDNLFLFPRANLRATINSNRSHKAVDNDCSMLRAKGPYQ